MEKEAVAKNKNGSADGPPEALWSGDAAGSCICFMCRRPVTGKVQPTVDMLSTVVSKVTVREKVEHETGCQLSTIQRLPTGVCSDCYRVVNEIDLLEHKLNWYRSLLRSNVQASISNFKRDVSDRAGKEEKLDANLQHDCSSVASASEDSSVDNFIAVDDGNYDNISVSLNDMFSKNHIDGHSQVQVSSSISLASQELSSSGTFPSLPLQLSPIPLTSKADTATVSKLISPSACSMQFSVASASHSNVCQSNRSTTSQSSYINSMESQEKPCNLSVDSSNGSSSLLSSANLNEIPVCMMQPKSFHSSENQGCSTDSVSSISFCQLESLEHCPPSQVLKESPKKLKKTNFKTENSNKASVSSLEVEMYQFSGSSIDFGAQNLSNITPSILSSSASGQYSSNTGVNIDTTAHASSAECAASASTPQKTCSTLCSGATPKKVSFVTSGFNARVSRSNTGVSGGLSSTAVSVNCVNSTFGTSVVNVTSCSTSIDAHCTSSSSGSSVPSSSHSSSDEPVSLKVQSPGTSSKPATSNIDASSCVVHEDQTISSVDIMDISHSLSQIRSCCESSARICPSNFVFNSPNDDSLDSSMNNSFLSANCPISISLLSPSFPSAPTYSSLLSPESQVVSCTSPSFLLSLHSSSLDANLFSYANDRTSVSKPKENQAVETAPKTSPSNSADKSDGDLIHCSTSSSMNELYDLPLMFPKTKESPSKHSRDQRKTKLEKSPEKQFTSHQENPQNHRISSGVSSKFSASCAEVDETPNKHTTKIDAPLISKNKLANDSALGKRTKRCVNELPISDAVSETDTLAFANCQRPSFYVKCSKKHVSEVPDAPYLTSGKACDGRNENACTSSEFRHGSLPVSTTTVDKIKISELSSEMISGTSKSVASCTGVTLQADSLLHAKSPSHALVLFDSDHGLKNVEGFATHSEITSSLSFENETLINALKNGAPSLLLNSERCEGMISSLIHGSSSMTCKTNQANMASHANSHSSTLSPVKTLQCSSHPAVKVSTSILDNYQDSLKSDHIHSQLSGNFDSALPITSIFNSKPSFRSNELLRIPDEGSNMKFSDALTAKISFPLCSPTYSHFTTGIVASTVTSSSVDCLPSVQSDLITTHRQFLSPTTKSPFCNHSSSSSRHNSVVVTQDNSFGSSLPSTSSKNTKSESVARASPMKTRSSKKLEMAIASNALQVSSQNNERANTALTLAKSKEKRRLSMGKSVESTKPYSDSADCSEINPLAKPSKIHSAVQLESNSCFPEDSSQKKDVPGKRTRYSKATRRKSKRKTKFVSNEKEEEGQLSSVTPQNVDCASSLPSSDSSLSCESAMKNELPLASSNNSSECEVTKTDAVNFNACKKSLLREPCGSSAGKELSKPLEPCEDMELIFCSAPFDYTNSNGPLISNENCSNRVSSFNNIKNEGDKTVAETNVSNSRDVLKIDAEAVQSTAADNNQWENLSLASDKTCSSGDQAVDKEHQNSLSNSKCQPDKNGSVQGPGNSSMMDSNLVRNISVNSSKENASVHHVPHDVVKPNTNDGKESSNNPQGNFDSTRSSIISTSHRSMSSTLVQNETLNMSTEFFEHIVASSSDASHFSIDAHCIPVDGHGLIPDGCDRSSFTVPAELMNHAMGTNPPSTVKNCPSTFSNTLPIPASNTSTNRQSSNFAQTIEVASGNVSHTNLSLASHGNTSMPCKQPVGNIMNNVDSFSALHFPSTSRTVQGQSHQDTRISNLSTANDNKINSSNTQRYFYSDINSSSHDASSALRLHSEMDNSGAGCTKSVLTQCNFPQNNNQVCHPNQVLGGSGGRQMMTMNKIRSSNMMSESNCSNNQNQALFGQVIEQNNFDSRRPNNALNRSNVSGLSSLQVPAGTLGRSESSMDKKLPGFVNDVPQNGSTLLQFENYKQERPYCQKNDVHLQASLGSHLIHGNGVNGDIHSVHQQHQFQNNCTYPGYQEMMHPCNQVPINNSNFVNYPNSNSTVQNYARNQVNDMRNFPNAYNPHIHSAQHSSSITVATPQQMMGCAPNTYFQSSNLGSRCLPPKVNPNQMGCGPQTTLNAQHAPINNPVHDLPLLEEDQAMLLSSFTSQSNLSHLSASVYAVSNQSVSSNAENTIHCKNSHRSVQDDVARDHAVKSASNTALPVSSSLEHSVEIPAHHCMSTYDANGINRQSSIPSKMRGNILQNDSSNCQQVLCNPDIANHAAPPLPYALNTPNVGMHSHPVQIHPNNIYGENAQHNHNVMAEQQIHYVQQHNLGYCANNFCEVPSVHSGMPYQYPDYHRNKHNLHNHAMSEYVSQICDVSGQQHMFQETLHNAYASSLVPQAPSNNFSTTEIYGAMKKSDSPTDMEGRNTSVCAGSAKANDKKQKCLISEGAASSSSVSISKTESCKKPTDNIDMTVSASCVANYITDSTRVISSKLIRERDTVQLETIQTMAVACLPDQMKPNGPQSDCILSGDEKAFLNGVESNKNINHTTYELNQVLLDSEKIEDSSLRRDTSSELNSTRDQSSPVDVGSASNISLEKSECTKNSDESKTFQANASLESTLINYTNPYSVVSSVKTATEMDIDIEECDCSDDHMLLDPGPSDHSDIPKSTEFDEGNPSSEVTCSEEHDLLNLKVSKDEVQATQERAQTASHNSEDSNPVDGPPCKLLDRPPTPELLRNVQEATEYHKPTLLTRNFKMKKHAKLQICRQCDQVFSTRHCLVRHIERRHKINVTHFTCPNCEKKCNTEKSLARHMLQHKTFSCKLCQETFSSRKNFKKHIEQHSRENLTCQDCFKSCSTFQALIAHMASHKRAKATISCNICNKEFANKRNLAVHQLTHTGERPHSCSNCQKSFSVRSNMLAHEERCLDKCRFKCKICSRGFPLESVYKRHLAEHDGKFAYSCNVCKKGFSKPSGLKAHMKTHDTTAKTSVSSASQRLVKQGPNKTKTHCTICPVCSKRLARYQLLKDHLARHANQRNYECPDCGQVFYYKSNIRSHQRAQHLNIKKHVCPECSKSFSSKNQLKNHLSVHTGAKPHQCKICGKAFSVHSNYVRHLKCHNNASSTTKST